MSDRFRRYLVSRKNIAGMAGALVGVGAHAAGLLGDVWPLVAAGLYGVGALLAPVDPAPEPERLTDALRAESTELSTRAKRLPRDVEPVVRRILEVLGQVLDGLDVVAEQPIDRAAAPERLATAAQVIREDLPLCLDTFLNRPPSSSLDHAVGQLATQLSLIAGAVDRLADAMPNLEVDHASNLTDELRRRHAPPT